ncbi:Cytosolic phospholipase A2 zeta [Durusdinium trenchii]|uniref:Cytosolic phospholipase A2 zeta n=1 Tax=Durusdinium trenchii TaxID=1381693 RepID=A0ABP0J9P1_9DINO
MGDVEGARKMEHMDDVVVAAMERDVKRASMRHEGGEEGRMSGAPEGFLLQGYLKKGEWKAPTQCGCIPVRDRQYKDKFVALDLSQAALVYAKNRMLLNTPSCKVIPFNVIKHVALEGESSNRFRVFLKSGVRGEFKGREYFSWSAVNHHTAQEWVQYLQECSFLRATVYTVGSEGAFPEVELGVKTDTAICLSGGGARAHVAAMGQLRALHILGLLNRDDINYMSSVSGSAWATCIYTFYEKGAHNDEHLLGPRTYMDDLGLRDLANDPCPMGKVATTEMWKLAESLFWSTNSHEWWERTVGEVYLEPFGLNDDLSYGHHDMAALMKASNTQLFWKGKSFHYARRDRPFWIANAAVLGPKWAKAGDIYPVQFTPMYSGTPFPHKMHLRDRRHHNRQHDDVAVGGGMIDSFAFGSDAPVNEEELSHMGGSRRRLSLRDGAKAVTNAASQVVREMFKAMEGLINEHEEEIHLGVGKRLVRVPYPEKPLTLRHTVGIASHAPAFFFKNYGVTNRLNPRSKYWSLSQHGGSANRRSLGAASAASGAEDDHGAARPAKEPGHETSEMDFADGGTLDNIGLLAMLQRRVKRIVVCVNSEVPLPMKPKKKRGSVRKSIRKIRTSRRVDGDFSSVFSSEDGSAYPESVTSGGTDVQSYIEEEEVMDEVFSFIPTYADWPQASILPLFGIEVPVKGEWGNFAHNQVFRRDRILSMLEQLQRHKLNGEPLIARDRYHVMRNDWWGIKGNFEVEIMWIYLDKVRSFELQLPTETRAEIDRGIKGAFPRFPTYKTFGTKKGKWIEPSLTNEQVNLLSALTEWSILHRSDEIKAFFRGELDEPEDVTRTVTELKEHGFV